MVVDVVTGFGDGVYEAITFGLGDLQDIRDLADIDGGIDRCSREYGGSALAGNLSGGIATGGALWTKSFQPGGWLNSNRYLRIGWGRHQNHRVFRISGKLVRTPTKHIDVYRGRSIQR